MVNQEYRDLKQLRSDVVDLIVSGRYRFTRHAHDAHPKLGQEAKLATILYGSKDQPNAGARPGRASYVCWFRHPEFGLLRGVYAIEEPPLGGRVVVITVFQD